MSSSICRALRWRRSRTARRPPLRRDRRRRRTSLAARSRRKISVINLNPTWTVPTSIIKKEIIPKMQSDPGYLTRAENPHPRRPRARKSIRAASTGAASARSITRCARIRAPAIRWARSASACPTSSPSTCTTRPSKRAVRRRLSLLEPRLRAGAGRLRSRRNGCWTGRRPPARGTRRRCCTRSRTAQRDDIKLATPDPVIWVYLTGWANGDGAANFRDDVYGLDTAAQTAAAAPGAPDKTP